jgi:excisionase family DNA binding protein
VKAPLTARTFEKLLTKKDVADLLGLTERTVERLIARGLFPRPLKVGHSVRWRVAVVEKFLEGAAV